MSKSGKTLARFKVYPKGKWYWFDVVIWKKKSEMIAHLKRNAMIAKNPGYEAICCNMRIYEIDNEMRVRKTGKLGEIHFYAGNCTMGIITHESGHAAFGWARAKGLNASDTISGSGQPDVGKGEEDYCWVLGNIARQIVIGMNDK